MALVEAFSALSLTSEDSFLVGFSLFGIPDCLLRLEFVHGILVINPNILVEGTLQSNGALRATWGVGAIQKKWDLIF